MFEHFRSLKKIMFKLTIPFFPQNDFNFFGITRKNLGDVFFIEEKTTLSCLFC